jgi:hypothetical protein
LQIVDRLGFESLEVLDQFVAALGTDDAPCVQQVRSIDPELLPEPIGTACLRHVDADADNLIRNVLIAKQRMHKSALFQCIEQDCAGCVKQGLV